jgi:hypothetical protein
MGHAVKFLGLVKIGMAGLGLTMAQHGIISREPGREGHGDHSAWRGLALTDVL